MNDGVQHCVLRNRWQSWHRDWMNYTKTDISILCYHQRASMFAGGLCCHHYRLRNDISLRFLTIFLKISRFASTGVLYFRRSEERLKRQFHWRSLKFTQFTMDLFASYLKFADAGQRLIGTRPTRTHAFNTVLMKCVSFWVLLRCIRLFAHFARWAETRMEEAVVYMQASVFSQPVWNGVLGVLLCAR